MSVRRKKDIFIIHSRQNREEFLVYRKLSYFLKKCGYRIWDYDDWEWESENIEEGWSSSGTEFDLKRIITKEEKVFKRTLTEYEINIESLEKIVKYSRAVIIINSSKKSVSKGVFEEIRVIQNLAKRCQREPRTRYILCFLKNKDKNNLFEPIEFDDSTLIEFENHISLNRQIPSLSDIHKTILIILKNLVNQSTDYEQWFKLNGGYGNMNKRFDKEKDIARSKKFIELISV